MEHIEAILAELQMSQSLSLEDIPNIDLYMDQVIQLFETTFGHTTRNEEEKVLTKTMINNYAKGKLLLPIKNKKYTKEHLILISLIYQLKGALSIQDIKTMLHQIRQKDLVSFYTLYLQQVEENAQRVAEDIQMRANGGADEVLFIASLIHMSNLYRRIAEKAIDQLPKKSVDSK